MGPMMRLIRSRVVSPGLDSGEVWLQLPGVQLQMTHENRTSNMLEHGLKQSETERWYLEILGKTSSIPSLKYLSFLLGLLQTVEKLEKLRYSNDDLLDLVLDFQTK
jgi:hypothetical protein